MTRILIVPGLGGSEDNHWQSHLERAFPGAERVEQADWNRPDLEQWLHNLARAVERRPDAILVAHSLGCILVAHLAQRFPDLRVRSALMVAPADVEAARRSKCLRAFAPLPRDALPFRNIVVASTNDPFMEIGRARVVAHSWGAEFVNAGSVGHINVAAGFGRWNGGEDLVRTLLSDPHDGRVGQALPVGRSRPLAFYPSA